MAAVTKDSDINLMSSVQINTVVDLDKVPNGNSIHSTSGGTGSGEDLRDGSTHSSSYTCAMNSRLSGDLDFGELQ